MANFYGWTPTNITTNTTTLVRSGPGIMHTLVVNKSVASAVITIFDSLTNAGTKIGTITLSSGGVTDMVPLDGVYDCAFVNGLTIVTSAATDITVNWAPS